MPYYRTATILLLTYCLDAKRHNERFNRFDTAAVAISGIEVPINVKLPPGRWRQLPGLFSDVLSRGHALRRGHSCRRIHACRP